MTFLSGFIDLMKAHYEKYRNTNASCTYTAVLFISMQYSTYFVLYHEYD